MQQSGVLDRIETMTGAELDRFARTLPSAGRDITARRGGGGTGAGPSAPAGTVAGLGQRVQGEDIIREAVTAGIPEASARAMAGQRGGIRALTQAIATAGRQQAGAGAAHDRQQTARDEAFDRGVEITTGVVSHLHDPIGDTEARSIREGLGTAASQAANLRGITAIANDFGGLNARISPTAEARLTPRLTIARGMVATLGQTGVIQQSEVPAINAALPNPQDLQQMTFGTFNARMREWQQSLEESMSARLTVRGVPPEGIQRAIQMLRLGHPAPAAAPPAERPQMQAQPAAPPQGRIRIRVPGHGTGTWPAGQPLPPGAEVIDGP
jgi:hypothetical protein